MGLRSPDKRLKKAAVSLIWVTDQLTDEQKISRLESIVRNSIDVAAEYAFRLLYAFVGRPKAWDEADAALKEGNESAKKTLADKQAQLDAQIEEANRHFKEFEEIPGNKSQRQNAINQRRAERDQTVRQLELQKDEAQKAYEKAIAEADDAHKAKMAVKLSDADQEVLGARFARRDALLSMAIGAYAEKLTKIGVDLALRELCRRRPYAEQEKEEYPGYYIQLLRVLEEGLTCSYSNTVRHTAMSMAKNLFVTAYPVLLRYLNSHDRQDQKDGLRGLVMLGQNALTSFKDEEGNAFERTSVIFLDRLADDRFGNIDRKAYFDAIAQLRDRHPSVVETLFEFLDRGTQDPDYTSALRALISISRCTEPVLTNVAWRDLSKNHFSVLQKHLVRELDWDQVSIEQFIEFYDMVYDEVLFARIIDNLYMRSDYASILKFRLIHWAKYTKGFDIKKHLREEEGKTLVRKSPIDEILQTFASLRKAPNMQDLAIRALVYRLDHRDLWVPDARDQAIEGQSVLLEALTESLGTLETEVTELQLLVAECLARAGKQSLSTNVFSYLMKVAVGVNYSIEWRIRAMRTLGHLADERAVVTLLMAAGFDAFGEKIPMEDNVSISAYNQERLAVVAAEALGGIIFAQEAEGIFQLISSMTRSRNSNTKEKGYRALRYFSRSDAHALEVARLLAQRLQVALNRNNASETRFYSNLFFELLEPIPDENKHRQDSRTNALIISETKETLLKEYMLATLFGDVFNLEGDPFYPLSVEKTLWEISNNSLLEKTYREVRQLIHGEFAKREFIDLAYLKDKSEEERIERLRPEMLLFKNKRKIAYTEEAVDALADYLSVDQLFALVAYAEEEEYHSGNLRERYRTIQHALVYRESPPIKEALSRFKQDYLVDVENFEDASLLYTNTAMAIFNEHRDRLETYKSDFFSVMSDFFRTIGALVGRLKQGEKGIEKVITHYMVPLQSLLERTIQLGWSDEEKTGLSEMIAALLSWKDDINVDVTLLLKQYFFVGNIDWNLIESLLEQSSRENRLLFVHLLTPTLAKDCTPKILGWLLEDNAALIRLADVLRSE
ncbi:MAG: cell envelope integrity protein TolA [Myxococcota bacterium]|nr:cell envelope integrity protein TolA [Myxococcota bacterium]